MADNEGVVPEEQPVVSEPVTPAETTTPAPALKTRWRDRAWSFRAMIAVAVASVLIGGVAGGVVVAASGGHDRDHHRMGPWGPGMQVPPGWRGRGPRNFGGDGGPQWRWGDGSQEGPNMTPYGTPTPQPPAATPTPGSTG